ncbi:hypothetical protein [Actinocrispum sp. NPDC049592]|uniref:hypothetical protein n=1 Tax=Actinocrispum sp. NPDC049592 TaxID=3154835 RepID=UPI003425450D
MRKGRALLVTAATLSLLVGLVAPASADTAYASCGTSVPFFGHFSAEGQAHYYIDGAQDRVFTDYDYILHGGNDKSNMYISVEGLDGFWYGVYGSPDDRHAGEWYHADGEVAVPSYFEPNVAFEAVFDIFGPDPRCTARTSPL